MFIPTSVARMPIIRPAEPVMTPAERSNSPPIMSSATATAGMPIVDATSVQFAIPSSFRNSGFCVQKKIATTTAASSAPISGRRRMRAVLLMSVSRSSATGAGGGAADAPVAAVGADPDDMDVLRITCSSPPRPGAGPRGTCGPAVCAPLAGPRRRQLRDGGRVALLDEARAGEDRLPAAHGVRVGLVELQEHDRQVALQVLLLVDREQHAAGLDV